VFHTPRVRFATDAQVPAYRRCSDISCRPPTCSFAALVLMYILALLACVFVHMTAMLCHA
jgi:hypothetical protein